MGAVSITKFIGEAPKLDPELLPNSAAQIASNVKLYSGDLLPYNQSSLQFILPKTGPILSMFPLVNPADGTQKWLHWNTDVDTILAPVPNNSTAQRIYYTGDATGNGEPKASNYTLATTGAGTSYPYGYYTLGVPAPLTAPTATSTPFTPISGTQVSSVVRSAGNLVTVTTAAAHNLNTGAYVTITNITVDTTYNVTNAQITVTSPTSFTYYANGAVGNIGTPSGSGSTGIPLINLSGLQLSRTYVYTWMTAWGEESAPSPASPAIYLYEGQQVTLTGLPSAFPTTGVYAGGVYQTSGMTINIYRTVSSTTGTNYFTTPVMNVAVGTTTVVDNNPVAAFVTALPSTTWFPPPAGLTGIRAIHNGMLVGFTGSTVCFCEPGQPHSWPPKYYQELGTPIVSVSNVGTIIVVLTQANPWIIQGSTPLAMQKMKLDTNMPCVSKRGVVSMDWGLCYPTRGGIAVFSMVQGASLATNYVYDWDNFRTIVDPTTITAVRYNNKYMASHSQGVFVFEKDEHTGGYLTETTQQFSAVYYNPNTAKLNFAFGTPSTMYLWDDPTQGFTNFEWKSKVMRVKDYMNLGAARVIADFSLGSNYATQNATILATNAALIAAAQVGGALAGNGNRFGPSPTGTQNDIGASLAGVPVAASRLKPLLGTAATLQFYFYVNGVLAFTTPVINDTPFRLPTGYRVDKFEVRVTGNARVRSIQLGETMQGLKTV